MICAATLLPLATAWAVSCHWTTRTAPSASWTAVTYGNGLFVAVATNKVMTSPDGITWTDAGTVPSASWAAVAYGNSLFVATASGGKYMTSSNGTSWTSGNMSNGTVKSMAYGNGLFVVVGGNPGYYSADGTNWSTSTMNGLNGLTYGNGLFVGVGASGRYSYTSDGTGWPNNSKSGAGSMNAIAYGNGLYVAVGDSGATMTSPDGSNWTVGTIPGSNNWTSIAYGNGIFVAVASSGTDRLIVSADGINWTPQTVAASTWTAVTGSDNYGFAAVGTNTAMNAPCDGSCINPNGVEGTVEITGGVPMVCEAGEYVTVTTAVSTTSCATTNQRDRFANIQWVCDGSKWNNLSIGAVSGTCATAGQVDYFGGRYHTCNGTNWKRWCVDGETVPTGVSTYPAYGWGNGSTGLTGRGNTTDAGDPVAVDGGWGDWTDIDITRSASLGHACGIRGGQAYCWGYSYQGKMGNGSTAATLYTSPVLVSGGWSDWTRISTGNTHTCGIRGGQAYCWGDASSGALGNSSTTPDRSTPSLVLGGWSDWTEISAGYNRSCGIRSTGIAYCWGSPTNGNLGNGTNSGNRTTPSLVLGGWTNWTRISTGTHLTQAASCGIRGGTAYCWGTAINGALGNSNTTVNRTSPSIVSGTWTDWTDINVGATHVCGIRGGQAYCWGAGTSGKLGDGTTLGNRTTPSLVLGGWTDWTKIAAGDSGSCGIRGGVGYCWGGGALGRGSTSDSANSPTTLSVGPEWVKIVPGYYNNSVGIVSSAIVGPGC